MADLEVFGSYQGRPCSEVHWSRTVGLDPDRGQVTVLLDRVAGPIHIRPQGGNVEQIGRTQRTVTVPFEGAPGIGGNAFNIFGDLVIGHEGGPVQTFQRVYIDESGIKTFQVDALDPSLKAATINLVDERWRWQSEGHVAESFNIEVEGEGIEIEGKLFDPDTVNGRRLWTLGEMIEKAVKQLPKPGGGTYTIAFRPNSGKFESEKPLTIDNGAGKLAAQLINELLNQYGIWVSFNLDRELEFLDTGEQGVSGAPEDVSPEFRAQGTPLQNVTYRYKPVSVEVVGERKIIEVLCNKWVPVTTFDRDEGSLCEGDIINLFRALELWGLDAGKVAKAVIMASKRDSAAFEQFEQQIGGERGKKVRRILEQTAYKWFRLADEFKHFLPIMRDIPIRDSERVQGKCVQKQFHPIKVIGQRFFPDSENDWNDQTAFWVNRFGVDLSANLSDVDYERGILKFNLPVGILHIDNPQSDIRQSTQINKRWSQVLGDLERLADDAAKPLVNRGIETETRALRGFENNLVREIRGQAVTTFASEQQTMITPFEIRTLSNGDTVFNSAEIKKVVRRTPRTRQVSQLTTREQLQVGKVLDQIRSEIRDFERQQQEFKQKQVDDIARQLANIALVDSRIREDALKVLHKLEKSADMINLEEMTLKLPFLSVTFAWEVNRNQEDDYYRFRFDVPKQEKEGGTFRVFKEGFVEFRALDGSNNKAKLDEEARKIVEKIFEGPIEVVDANWEFGGAHRVEVSGRVMQVSWDMIKESAVIRTRVLTRDPFHGIDNRPGAIVRTQRVFNRSDQNVAPRTRVQNFIDPSRLQFNRK